MKAKRIFEMTVDANEQGMEFKVNEYSAILDWSEIYNYMLTYADDGIQKLIRKE